MNLRVPTPSIGSLLAFALTLGAAACASATDYPLDALSRDASDHGESCPEVPLVTYRGTTIRYDRPVRVYAGLIPRLRALEELAAAVGREVYGRAPTRLVHAGAYACRNVRGSETRISEHAFGNALDVRGFDFARVSRRDGPPTAEASTPRLRRAFTVRVGARARDAQENMLHTRFISLLRERARHEALFRRVIGPPYRGHDNHLHFDMGPSWWQWLSL